MSELLAVVPGPLDLLRMGTRGEAQAAAQRLTGAWRFFQECLRTFPEADLAVVDTYDAIAAEIGAAVGRTYRYGHQLIEYGAAMYERLPLTGAALAAGDISYFVFRSIVYRTALITDPEVLAAVDARIAAAASRWACFSRARLAGAVDAIVVAHDPDAVRRQAEDTRSECGIEISSNARGYSEVHGTMLASTGMALDARLDALADTVCAHDPRPKSRRRADAIDVMVAGLDRMVCHCRREDCAARRKIKRASDTVVYLVGQAVSAEAAANAAQHAPAYAAPQWRPGYLFGSDELIPPSVMADIAASAKVVTVCHPGPDSAPEPRYRPSKALSDYVRARDLTCRAPGCDRPATDCEIDHTVPHDAGGPTHASNLKCLCAFHHLVKTFWRWLDEQLPDGTVIWRTPAGQTFVTYPGSMLLFPELCEPTGWLGRSPARRPSTPNHPNMPQRNQTRVQERAARINTERQRNHADATKDPPPF